MKQTLDLQKSTLAHRPSSEKQNLPFFLIYLHLFLPFLVYSHWEEKQNLAIGHGSADDGQKLTPGLWMD